MIREEIDVHTIDEIFWTNSQIVLGYIYSVVQRFKIFVNNPIEQIRDQTDTRQWHYVETTNNPADDASRDFEWCQDNKGRSEGGSKVHSYGEKNIIGGKNSAFSSRYQMMIKKVHKVNPVQVENGVLVLTCNLSRMRTIMARLIKIRYIWLKRIAKITSIIQLHDSSDVKALQEAQDLLFKMVQGQSFVNEKKHLLEVKLVPRGSSIVKMDQFLDDKGIIRVGSRLKSSWLAEKKAILRFYQRNVIFQKG